MRPIRTKQSNFTYLGPDPAIGDLPCRRQDGRIYAVYALTDAEREMIANGAQIQLGIYTEPIPPVSMTLVTEPEVDGVDELGSDFRCERCDGLYVKERAEALGWICGWCEGKLEPVTVSASSAEA